MVLEIYKHRDQDNYMYYPVVENENKTLQIQVRDFLREKGYDFEFKIWISSSSVATQVPNPYKDKCQNAEKVFLSQFEPVIEKIFDLMHAVFSLKRTLPESELIPEVSSNESSQKITQLKIEHLCSKVIQVFEKQNVNLLDVFIILLFTLFSLDKVFWFFYNGISENNSVGRDLRYYAFSNGQIRTLKLIMKSKCFRTEAKKYVSTSALLSDDLISMAEKLIRYKEGVEYLKKLKEAK